MVFFGEPRDATAPFKEEIRIATNASRPSIELAGERDVKGHQ
jgi:hypothetical protein